MKTMKFSIKVLMAMLLFCLPFAITSCGSDDDDDDSPKQYKYEWMLSNATINNGTVAEQQAAVNAQASINTVLVKAFQAVASGVVDSSKQTLTITGGEEKANDNLVKSAYWAIASQIATIAEPLPANARITVKRGGTKVIDEKLK
jgi:hypothetical protein